MLMLAPVVWMVMDRELPYVYRGVEIAPKDVEPGGEIHITFHVHQLRAPCSAGVVYREFKESSGKLHTYDPIVRLRPPDIVDGRFTRTAHLPSHLAPGLTIYRGAACYHCNPLQQWLRWPVCVPTPDVPFNVVAPP